MSKKIETRKCETCGKKFTPNVANQRYCCKACKNVAKRKAEKVKRAAEKKPEAKGKTVKAEEKKPVAKAELKEKVVLKKGKAVKTDTFLNAKGDNFKIIALCLLTMLQSLNDLVEHGRIGDFRKKDK